MRILLAILLLLPFYVNAQDEELNTVMQELQFSEDSIKTVFDWIANNIRYDVKKLERIEEGKNKPIKGNFKTRSDYEKQLLKKVITHKKGVCQDYSILFDAMVNELGYESMIVKGYTKDKQGKINHKIGHTWNAVKVNNEWKLYDPTWGAGVVDGSRFKQQYNIKWYETPANEMVKTHMPYDPIWQLLDQPVSYDEFKDSDYDGGKLNPIDFHQMISEHLSLSDTDQAQAELDRSKQMGKAINHVKKWHNNTEKRIQVSDTNDQVLDLSTASETMTEIVGEFNEYIDSKNKRFKTNQWTIEYAKQRLPAMRNETIDIKNIFEDAKDVKDTKMKRSVIQSINQIKQFLKRVDEEVQYLEKV